MKPVQALIVAAFVSLTGCAQLSQLGSHEGVPVTITGVHYMGENFSIADVWVNGSLAGDVWRGGGGGSFVCCVILPEKWTDKLNVEVQWKVYDWSNANEEEIERNKFSSVRTEGIYRAIVPVDPYPSPQNLFVHLFPGGRVRVVSSRWAPRSINHPVGKNDANNAYQGIRIDKIKHADVRSDKQ